MTDAVRHVENVSDEFALSMVALAEAYGTKLTEQRIRLYAEALADIPPAALRRAFHAAVCECRFFPTVAELRAFVLGTAEERALLAWTALQQAAAKVGAWQSLEFEDASAADALQLVFGSWPNYCALEGPAVGARKAEFIAAYRASNRRTDRRTVRLLGLHEVGGATGTSGGARTWVGCITSGGDVRTEANRPRLAGGENVAALVE